MKMGFQKKNLRLKNAVFLMISKKYPWEEKWDPDKYCQAVRDVEFTGHATKIEY